MPDPDLDQVTMRPLPALGRMAISVQGALDWDSGERLAARAIAALAEGWAVDLDLSAVTFADGGGREALGRLAELLEGLPEPAQASSSSMMPSITSRNLGTSSGLVRYSAAPSSRIRRT